MVGIKSTVYQTMKNNFLMVFDDGNYGIRGVTYQIPLIKVHFYELAQQFQKNKECIEDKFFIVN